MVLVKGTEWSCGTEKKVRGITHKNYQYHIYNEVKT